MTRKQMKADDRARRAHYRRLKRVRGWTKSYLAKVSSTDPSGPRKAGR